MRIASLQELVGKINEDLGDFCSEFAYKRKELARMGSCTDRSIFFKYDEKSDRDWAINEGGGTEIQYHIDIAENNVNYGLAFSAQYVPFKIKKMKKHLII